MLSQAFPAPMALSWYVSIASRSRGNFTWQLSVQAVSDRSLVHSRVQAPPHRCWWDPGASNYSLCTGSSWKGGLKSLGSVEW